MEKKETFSFVFEVVIGLNPELLDLPFCNSEPQFPLLSYS